MSHLFLSLLLSFLLFHPQVSEPNVARPEKDADVRLPSGKSQRNEILKADHAKNVEDAKELVRLSEELKADLEKNTEYVFSIATLKKAEEIEKTAHKIRSR